MSILRPLRPALPPDKQTPGPPRPAAAKAERWPSGRRRTPGKCVGGEPSQGFESLSLRHATSFSALILLCYCRQWIPHTLTFTLMLFWPPWAASPVIQSAIQSSYDNGQYVWSLPVAFIDLTQVKSQATLMYRHVDMGAILDIMPAALRIGDVATYLGISRANVYRLIQKGELHLIHVGGRSVVRRTDADAYLNRCAGATQRHPAIDGVFA